MIVLLHVQGCFTCPSRTRTTWTRWPARRSRFPSPSTGCAAWRSSTRIPKLQMETATGCSCGCTSWGCFSTQTPSNTCSPQVPLAPAGAAMSFACHIATVFEWFLSEMSAKFAAFRPIFVIIDGNVVHVIEWTDYNRISSVFKVKESSWSVLPSAIWSSWRPCLKRDTSGKSVSTRIHTHVSVSENCQNIRRICVWWGTKH